MIDRVKGLLGITPPGGAHREEREHTVPAGRLVTGSDAPSGRAPGTGSRQHPRDSRSSPREVKSATPDANPPLRETPSRETPPRSAGAAASRASARDNGVAGSKGGAESRPEWFAALPGERDPAAGEGLADAFVAFLAEEQGEPLPPRFARHPVELSDAVIERIAEQVTARLLRVGFAATITKTVSEVSERLVREEIARIRGTSASAAASRTGGYGETSP